MRFILILLLIALPLRGFAEYETVEEIEKAYSEEACKACHPKVHEEWQSSIHANSVINSLGIMREYLVTGLKEWKKPVDREQIMRCMACAKIFT